MHERTSALFSRVEAARNRLTPPPAPDTALALLGRILRQERVAQAAGYCVGIGASLHQLVASCTYCGTMALAGPGRCRSCGAPR